MPPCTEIPFTAPLLVVAPEASKLRTLLACTFKIPAVPIIAIPDIRGVTPDAFKL